MAKAKTKKKKGAPKKKAAASIPVVPILLGLGVLYMMFAPQTTYAAPGGDSNGGSSGMGGISGPSQDQCSRAGYRLGTRGSSADGRALANCRWNK